MPVLRTSMKLHCNALKVREPGLGTVLRLLGYRRGDHQPRPCPKPRHLVVGRHTYTSDYTQSTRDVTQDRVKADPSIP